MSLENLLNHTCNIYHAREEQKSPGYGLPASPSFYYPEEPDVAEQECHFGVRSQSVTITQTQPVNIMDAKIKLTLPIGADIRLLLERAGELLRTSSLFPYAGDYDRRRNATDVFYGLRMVYHVFPPYGAGGVCSWTFSSYGD